MFYYHLYMFFHNISILQICILVFLILAAIGFVAGGSHRKMRQEEERIAKLNEEDERKEKLFQERIRKERRAELIKDREMQKLRIIEKNERVFKNCGYIWEDVDTAMRRYDDQHRKEWEEVGLKTPTQPEGRLRAK